MDDDLRAAKGSAQECTLSLGVQIQQTEGRMADERIVVNRMDGGLRQHARSSVWSEFA
jgi:hypothetical protein